VSDYVGASDDANDGVGYYVSASDDVSDMWWWCLRQKV
jgi:hypothetical protein